MRTQGDFRHERVENSPFISPHQAAQIDRKMDDGLPFSGGVRASEYVYGPDGPVCESRYVESVSLPTCAMYFILLP